MAEFKLGEVYRDGITGIIGLSVGIYNDISGEQTVTLQPQSQDGLNVAHSFTTNLKFLQPIGGEPEAGSEEGSTEEV